MPSTKSAAKDNKKSYMPLILDTGIIFSILNIFVFCFLAFTIIQLFIDPLNFILWISLTGISSSILLISLTLIFVLFSKVILNNSLFLKSEQKQEKKYFIAATVFFFFNSLISFAMFKNLMTKW